MAFERALSRQADRHRRKIAVVVVAVVAAIAAFSLAMATFDTSEIPKAHTTAR